jgi:hypothetical protein
MRDQVLTAIKELGLNGYKVSNELPFNESGVATYTKNPKTIYVDRQNWDDESIVRTMGGLNITNTTTTVRVYFATDAKNIPANYESTISSLRSILNSIVYDGAVNRETSLTTAYENDLLLSELEYRLIKLT